MSTATYNRHKNIITEVTHLEEGKRQFKVMVFAGINKAKLYNRTQLQGKAKILEEKHKPNLTTDTVVKEDMTKWSYNK